MTECLYYYCAPYTANDKIGDGGGLDEEGEDGTEVNVKMTLTAPGCGMGPLIAADAQSKIMNIPEIDKANVEVVWEPAWNQDMISEGGKVFLIAKAA